MANISTFTDENGNTYNYKDENGRSMIAPVESTNTASKPYAVDDNLIYNDVYYRVTQAIAQGGTITVGTNVAPDDVASSINRKIQTAVGDALAASY